jgi:predicted Rossmann-fold nucleotide-binding protein
MQQHSDTFLVMPGELGTLKEVFETWSAIKIGVIHKPIGFLNLNEFYDDFFAFVTQ